MYGQRIKELRESANLSQEDLGNALGEKFGEEYRCTQNAISKYEKEQREPRMDLLIKIVKFFGVSMDYILGIDDKKSTSLLDEVQRQLTMLDKDTIKEALNYVEYLKWRNNK